MNEFSGHEKSRKSAAIRFYRISIPIIQWDVPIFPLGWAPGLYQQMLGLFRRDRRVTRRTVSGPRNAAEFHQHGSR